MKGLLMRGFIGWSKRLRIISKSKREIIGLSRVSMDMDIAVVIKRRKPNYNKPPNSTIACNLRVTIIINNINKQPNLSMYAHARTSTRNPTNQHIQLLTA